MKGARWRWVLVPMVVVVAACLPHPSTDLPASFNEAFNHEGNPTFTLRQPPAGATGQDVVAVLRVQDPTLRGRAVPVFGVMDCLGNPACQPGPGGTGGGPARTVWVVLYPDCTSGGDFGWVVVDAITGINGGYTGNLCDHRP